MPFPPPGSFVKSSVPNQANVNPSGPTVTEVTATDPLQSSGGTRPNISLEGVVSPEHGGTGLGAPAPSEVGKVLTAKADGTYELVEATGTGTVTEVTTNAPLSVTSGTTTPDISISQANTTTDGYLSSTDWNTFNSKGTVTEVSGSAPISVSNGSSTPDVSISQSGIGTDGYLSSTDWNTFNNKVPTTRSVSAGAGLTGGGDLSTDREIAMPIINGDGGYTFYNPNITFDMYGRAIPVSNAEDPLTALLLHGKGTNGSQDIVDNSFEPKTVTAHGNAQISTDQSKFFGTSIKFDGNGDYITGETNNSYAVGTGNFTVETWLYLSSYGGGGYSTLAGTILDTRSSGSSDDGIAVFVDTSGNIVVFETGVGVIVTSTSPVSLTTWTHVAVVRTAGAVKIYLNGVESGTGAVSIDCTSNNLTIGAPIDGRTADTYLKFHGFMSDLRFSTSARYSADFSSYATSYRPPFMRLPDAALFGHPIGEAGGVLGYNSSTYPNPSGLAATSALGGGDKVIDILGPKNGLPVWLKPSAEGALYGEESSIGIRGSDGSTSVPNGGHALVKGGDGVNSTGDGGSAKIYGGVGATGSAGNPGNPGGNVDIAGGVAGEPGAGGTGGNTGGNVYINGGNSATGTDGYVDIGFQNTLEVRLGGGSTPVKIGGSYTLPTGDGAPNYVLKTNGSGSVSFSNTPAYGASGSLQYNNGGSLDSAGAVSYDSGAMRLSVPTARVTQLEGTVGANLAIVGASEKKVMVTAGAGTDTVAGADLEMNGGAGGTGVGGTTAGGDVTIVAGAKGGVGALNGDVIIGNSNTANIYLAASGVPTALYGPLNYSSSGAPQSVSSGGTVALSNAGGILKLIQASSTITLSATEPLENLTVSDNGRYLILVNGGGNDITIPSGGNTKIEGGVSLTISPFTIVHFMWIGDLGGGVGAWIQINKAISIG